MSVASFTPPTVTREQASAEGLEEKVSVRDLDFLDGDHRAL